MEGDDQNGRSHQAARGRALPDTDGPGFVALNGSFEVEKPSLIGQKRSFN
jgi:hypothetical protein